MITAAKAGKSIILTTHSMEEADVLCDRIGTMAKGKERRKGQVVCVGGGWGNNKVG